MTVSFSRFLPFFVPLQFSHCLAGYGNDFVSSEPRSVRPSGNE